MDDTFPQQIQIRPPVHLSFEHFDPIHMPFDRTGVVHQRQAGSDRIEVSAQPGDERPKRLRAGGIDIGHPLGQVMSTTVDHDLGETANVLTHGHQGGTAVADVGEPLDVLGSEIELPPPSRRLPNQV